MTNLCADVKTDKRGIANEGKLVWQRRKKKAITIGLCSCRDWSGIEGELEMVLRVLRPSWLWSPDRLENLDAEMDIQVAICKGR